MEGVGRIIMREWCNMEGVGRIIIRECVIWRGWAES